MLFLVGHMAYDLLADSVVSRYPCHTKNVARAISPTFGFNMSLLGLEAYI